MGVQGVQAGGPGIATDQLRVPQFHPTVDDPDPHTVPIES
jgi:hypothetical protein